MSCILLLLKSILTRWLDEICMCTLNIEVNLYQTSTASASHIDLPVPTFRFIFCIMSINMSAFFAIICFSFLSFCYAAQHTR